MMRRRDKLKGAEQYSSKGCIKQLKLGSSIMKWCNDFPVVVIAFTDDYKGAEQRGADINRMLYIRMLLWQFLIHNHSQLNTHKYCRYIKHSGSSLHYDKIIVCIPEVMKSNKIHQNQIWFHEAKTRNTPATDTYLHILNICTLTLK